MISDWEQGVRCVLGNARDLLTSENGLFGTGLHLFWPIIGEVLVASLEDWGIEPVSLRVINLSEAQPLRLITNGAPLFSAD